MSSGNPSKPRLSNIWSTASLRLALTFSAIFGVGGALFVAVVDFGVFRFAEAEVHEDLNHQMAIMQADAGRRGGSALVARLNAQPRNRQARRYLFLIIAPDGQSYSNGLTRAAVNPEGFRRNVGDKPRATRWPDQRPNMLVLSHTAPDGTLMAIGRDTKHLEELHTGLHRFALWGGVGLVTLALIAGLGIGYQFLRRLESVNESVERIISGDASERLPAIGFGREFDALAANLNRMLERQEAMMDALKTVSEGIAHDLRTPLGRLRNRLDELEAAEGDPQEVRARVDLAVDEVTQITALLESLLALSRLESQSLATRFQPVDAAQLVEGLGEVYRPVIEEAGGTIRISAVAAGEAPLMVSGDSHLLTQALSNLIENAINHAVGPPDITLATSREDGSVILSVADRGPGIPADERGNVVKRFYRLDRSRSRPGSGLGLAMCAAVARWHGGELELADNVPGLAAALRLPAIGR